jgi:hypothetical protein
VLYLIATQLFQPVTVVANVAKHVNAMIANVLWKKSVLENANVLIASVQKDVNVIIANVL